MTQIEEAKKTRMDQWKPSCGELVVIIEIGVNSTKTNAVFIYLLFIECNRHVRCSGVWALLMRRTLAVKFVLHNFSWHKRIKMTNFLFFAHFSRSQRKWKWFFYLCIAMQSNRNGDLELSVWFMARRGERKKNRVDKEKICVDALKIRMQRFQFRHLFHHSHSRWVAAGRLLLLLLSIVRIEKHLFGAG